MTSGHGVRQGSSLGACRRLLALFVALLLAQSSLTGVSAATPEAGATPVPAATPAAGAADPGSFAALGYGDLTATGMQASMSYFFPVPLGSQTGGGTLELHYSHSPLLIPEFSTMTVVVNGESIDSVFLTGDSAAGGVLSVPLPASSATESSLSVRLAFYLRLTRDDCEVPDNPALWATVSGTSRLQFAAADASTAHPLTSLASLFQRSAREQEGAGPVFVMPDDPSAGELDAAGMLAYQLGRWLGYAGQPALLSQVQSSLPPADTAAIVIGQAGSLSIGDEWGDLVWDGQQFLLHGTPVPAGHGVIALRPQAVPQLLVSGATEEAVRLAAEALAHPLDDQFFAAPAVVITALLPAPLEDRYAWRDGAASFAQLGMERRDVSGPGEHFIDLSFERPGGWVLQDGGTLQLVLDVSPAVRAETSWIRAVVNGLDVGAHAVQTNELGNARYVFNLPAGRLNNQLDGQPLRSLTLQIRLFLDYPENVCEVMDPQSVWATLLPSSIWTLPHEDASSHDVARFPTGLASESLPSSLFVVLPDDATGEETIAGLQALAAAARWSAFEAPVRPVLTTPGDVPDDALSASPAILIGGPERNGRTAELNAEAVTAQPPAVVSGLTQAYGSLIWLDSPWSDGDDLLVIGGSGEHGEGTLLAAQALAQRETLLRMQGARIVVTDGLASQSAASADPANSAPRELAPIIVDEERPWIEQWPAWKVVGAILVVAFIALVAGIVILRWIRGGTPQP